MQAKLLRVLQENEVRRVGGQRWLQVDMRVVAATNKDLAELVQQEVFREDLYYRLNVVTLTLPPHRERRDDIPALAQAFLGRASRENNKPLATISDEALELLSTYAWPGNIRELENTMERAVALSQRTVLVPDDLPEAIRNRQASDVTPEGENADAFVLSDFPTLEEVKKRYIVKVLHDTTGNVSRAAEVLDVDRRSLYRMMERYQIVSPRKKS
jgi:transcriptional regulator with PAS, ATPase and Fis domain